MEIAGVNLDQIWNKVDGVIESFSTFIREKAAAINLIAIGILSLFTLVIQPWTYLAGFTVFIALNAIDHNLGERIVQSFNRLLPPNPEDKFKLLGVLGMMTHILLPPLFGLAVGAYSGRRAYQLIVDFTKRNTQ